MTDNDLIERLRAEVAEARDGWRMANGTAELAMKHRDAAEARAERLESDMRALHLNYDAHIERLEDALRTAREYVAAVLEARDEA